MKLVELFSPAVLRRGVNVRRGGAVAGAVAVRAGIEVESKPAHLCVEDSRERLRAAVQFNRLGFRGGSRLTFRWVCAASDCREDLSRVRRPWLQR